MDQRDLTGMAGCAWTDLSVQVEWGGTQAARYEEKRWLFCSGGPVRPAFLLNCPCNCRLIKNGYAKALMILATWRASFR